MFSLASQRLVQSVNSVAVKSSSSGPLRQMVTFCTNAERLSSAFSGLNVSIFIHLLTILGFQELEQLRKQLQSTARECF